MRRLLLAPLLALMLVLGLVAGAAANGSDRLEVSGTMAYVSGDYSDEVVLSPGRILDIASQTFAGTIRIGDHNADTSFDVTMARKYNEHLNFTLKGSLDWDLGQYGICSGPASATMKAGDGTFPMKAKVTALCDNGEVLKVKMAGAYPLLPDGSPGYLSPYAFDVDGTLTLDD